MNLTTMRPPASPALAGPRPGWWVLTVSGAVCLTGFDGFLLQQKKAYFTGGFLAEDHAAGVANTVSFLVLSLVVDAAVVGAAVALALWLSARLRLSAPARGLAVLSLALAPLVIFDVLSYRLVAYLGDAFDLALMFDLTGRQPNEILAVAAPHLVEPAFAALGFVAVAGALVWALNRSPRSERAPTRVPPRVFAQAAAVFLLALIAASTARASSEVMDNGLRRKPSGKVLGWIVRAATDVDGDGYGLGRSLTDPSPFDATVFPYAADLPGNGIDENGVGGDLPAEAPSYIEPPADARSWHQRPDVVLFVLESFRADAVGAVVGGKPVTPTLNALAREGVLTTAAFSHNGYTTQSRLHLMSGSLAGIRGGRTLIDDFKSRGYAVGYFSGQDESFGGPEGDVGFDRADVAFDARQARDRRYSTFTTAGSLAVPHDVVQERLASFLESQTGDRPVFLYVNFHDTHYPYWHRGIRPLVSPMALAEAEIRPARAVELREMYLNTAANVDRAIGTALETIRRHRPAPPAIIVTADHGESLYDEGFLGHGYALNDAQTRIPLIATGLPLTIETPFGQSDLRDAIAEALGSPSPAQPPRLRQREDRPVFQYLGSLERPRQIAFTTGQTRTRYDFRTRRVQLEEGAWRPPASLDADAARRFLELVHFWERVVLARGASKRGSDE